METATTPGVPAAVCTARYRSEVVSAAASKRTMLAMGAMAWAHSVSSDSSISQVSEPVEPDGPFGSVPGKVVPPFSFNLVNVGLPVPPKVGRP